MLPTVICRGVMLLLLVCVATAEAAPDLDPRSIARRTPDPSAWRVDPVAPTAHFDRREVARWKEHRQRHRRVDLLGLALDLATYLLLLGSAGRALYRLARRVPTPRPDGRLHRLGRRLLGEDWLPALVFAYLYFALGVVLDLPLSIWHELIARQAHLSTYTAGRWVGDLLRGLLVSGLLYTFLVVGLYGLVRRFPRRFWLILALPVALGTGASALLSPLSPRLYHQITPIERTRYANPELVRRLRMLARSTSALRLAQVKVVDTSRRSRMFGAYITGLGPSRELVLSDTLLDAATPDEIEVVVAHELAHLRHGSPLGMHGLAALGLVALLGLFALVLNRGARWLGLPGPGDVRTLPLLGLTALLLFNLALPLKNAHSRAREREADRLALITTGNPEAFISLQVKLARQNQQDIAPSPWVERWLFSHPSMLERIGMARWYRRWLDRAGRQVACDRSRSSPAPIASDVASVAGSMQAEITRRGMVKQGPFTLVRHA